uniref:DUF3147 domain-containing protein n=1 Tax=viral metagenome TaxID=1070528 RepID=A0A6C0LM57_9ZZZZ
MDIVKPFLIGGSVIAGSKFVSKYASPALAPLIGGMPTGIIATYFMDDDKSKTEYYNGYAYSSFLLFIAILCCHLWSSNTDTPVNIISTVCILVWAILSYLVINAFVINAKSSKGKSKK